MFGFKAVRLYLDFARPRRRRSAATWSGCFWRLSAPSDALIRHSLPSCARAKSPGHERRDPGKPGRVPVHSRNLPRDVPQPALDHAPVCRVRHRRRKQSPLPLSAFSGNHRTLGSLRSAHPDGLRFRPSDGRRRSRPGRASPSPRWPTWSDCSQGFRCRASPRR